MSVKLTADTFFCDTLDLCIPMLKGIDTLYREQGLAAAEAAFAAFIRSDSALAEELFFASSPVKTPTQEELSRGERIVDGYLTSCGVPMHFPARRVDWTANPTFNGYKEWTWQLSRHPEWRELGELYRATGDERYTEAFEDYLLSFYTETEPPEYGTSGFATLSWRSLEAGIRMEINWPYAIMCFHKSKRLSDHAITCFFMSVYDNVQRVLHAPTSHNWLVTELAGLSTAALCFPFFRESAAWEEHAMRRLYEELDRQVYPDYFQHELTTGYHMVVINTYMRVFDVHKRMECPVSEQLRLGVANLFRLYIRLMMPDGFTPGTNDGGRINVADVCRRACEEFPEYRDEFSYIAYGEGKEPPFRSIMLPYSGYGVMRSGWGREDCCAMLESAPFGRAHQHEDKLQVMLHALGKRLLEDPGTYAYDTSDMRKYILSSYSHNVALVDGNGQNRRAIYRWYAEDLHRKADIRSDFAEDTEWVEGVYDEGFGPENTPVCHTRRLIWYKKGIAGHGTPFYVVLDHFVPKDYKVHTYTLLWHLMPNTAPQIEDARITADYGDGVHFHVIGMTKPEIVEGQKEPVFLGWRPVHAPGEHEHTPAPTATYTYEGRYLSVATVLYPSVDGCPIKGVSVGEEGEISFDLV